MRLRTRPCALALVASLGLSCTASEVKASSSGYVLSLTARTGTPPTVPNHVPHQQLDQNSPAETLKALRSFLFSLKHVEEKQTRISLPSARGAFIKSDVQVNPAINREFTHIHMEPGPGSQHLMLREADGLLTIKNGWGVKHPWSDRIATRGLMLLLIYAPRDGKDLAQIKKITTAAWHLALSDP